MSEKFRNIPTPETPRYARVEIEEQVPCTECGDMLEVGEIAQKQTIAPADTEGMTKSEIKGARTFAYFHNRCTPRPQSEVVPGQDALDSWRRLPGNFEGGKRR